MGKEPQSRDDKEERARLADRFESNHHMQESGALICEPLTRGEARTVINALRSAGVSTNAGLVAEIENELSQPKVGAEDVWYCVVDDRPCSKVEGCSAGECAKYGQPAVEKVRRLARLAHRSAQALAAPSPERAGHVEEIERLQAGVPPEEWDKLPSRSSEGTRTDEPRTPRVDKMRFRAWSVAGRDVWVVSEGDARQLERELAEAKNDVARIHKDKMEWVTANLPGGWIDDLRNKVISLQSATASRAIADVSAERRRQVEGEGWTAAHDDQHTHGDLAQAAACYAIYASGRSVPPDLWPWAMEWWKPKDRRRDLVRAAALVIAEIDRLDRAMDSTGGQDG